MGSGPWFYEIPVTVRGLGDAPGAAITDLHLFPGQDIVIDTPITAQSWVWASITELDGDNQPFLGDASIWVANVAPRDDGGIWVRILSDWKHDLNGLVRLLFWASV